MTNDSSDTKPLSQLIQQPADIVAQVRRTGQPVVLTVDGKAEMVVMPAAEYEAWHVDPALDISIADLQAAIAEGDAGLARPAREVIAEIFAKHGL